MNLSDNQAFATELVSRGVSVTQVQTMMTDMGPVMSKIQANASMSDIYPDLHTMIDHLENIEAFVSAFVRVELPANIQAQIDYYTDEDGTCEIYDMDTCVTYHDYSEEIMYLNRLLSFVETYPDETVESVMVVVSYLLRIESTMNAAWFSDVESLMDVSSPTTTQMNLAISLKNGLVLDLKEEMPSHHEFMIFNQTMMTLVDTLMDNDRMNIYFDAEKNASQIQMSLNLFYDFVLAIDADYLNGLKTAFEDDDPVAILTTQLTLINAFIQDNETEIDALVDIYSDQEKEDIFFDLLVTSILESQISDATEQADIMLIIEENIDFTNLLTMKSSGGDFFIDFLDQLDESDYELIYALYDLTNTADMGSFIEDGDSGMDANFKITSRLDPGQYVISVRGYSSSEMGPYDLYIYKDIDTVPVLIEEINDSITMFGENQYTFTITQATTIEIYTESDIDTYGMLSEYVEITMTEEEVVFNALNAFMDTMNPLIQTMTEDDYTLLIENMIAFVKTAAYINHYYVPMDIDQLADLEESLDIFLNTSPYQYVLMKTFMNQMDTTTYLSDLELAMNNQDIAEVIVLQLDFINTFIDASEIDLDAVITPYTPVESEAIFFDLIIANILRMQGFNETEQDDVMLLIENNVDFATLMSLFNLADRKFNDVLDRFDETDYELIYQLGDLIEIDSAYYEDLNQYDLDRTEAMALLIDSFIDTFNPLVQDMTEDEYDIVIDNIIQIVKTSMAIEDYHYDTYTDDEITAYNLIFTTLSALTSEEFTIMQTLMNQIQLSDIFMYIYDIYYVSTVTATPDQQDYGMIIEFANVYVDTYALVETDIDDIIAGILLLVDDTKIQSLFNILPEDVATIKTIIEDYPNTLYDHALLVVDYDYTNLTSAEIETLEELIYWIETPYMEEPTQ